jgi:hypothetical protein
LAHAFLLEYSDKMLKLPQLLGQLQGVFLTCAIEPEPTSPTSPAGMSFRDSSTIS